MNFLSHAAAHGLVIQDLIADGRWHRCRTEDKPRKKNGAYLFDGVRGVVINFATMVHGSVFRPDGKAEQIDRSLIREMQAEAAKAERMRRMDAQALAADMVKRASIQPHPYLAAKGFPQEQGLVLDEDLLIPMREFTLYRQINSVQSISPDGKKLFLPGGKAKGSVYFIGPMVPNERWLCEGYATALSVRAALRELHRDAQVVVCFSAGNLAHVGQLVKGLKPEAYVMADNDQSGAGAKAAEETGLPWVMSPAVGEDANDFHMRAGIRALASLIRTVRARAAEAA